MSAPKAMLRIAPRSRKTFRCARAILLICLVWTGSAVASTAVIDEISADASGAASGESDAKRLASYRLMVPVVGTAKKNLIDTYNDRREGHPHEALDIPAPRGTPVVAAGDGRVVKLFRSAAGGLTVYQFDPSERFAYYYAHLDKYASGLAEGMILKRGDAIGAVGSTGNASPGSPHLHFAVFRLGPEKKWWKGSPINPFPLLD